MKLVPKTAISLLVIALIFNAAPSNADTFVFPHLLEYQGRLTDASGVPVPDGSHMMTFRLFDAPTGGSELWSETHAAVQSTNGLLAVHLGAVTPIPMDVISGGQGYNPELLYLEIQIQGEPPLAPRTTLGASAYSAVAKRLHGDVTTAPGELLIVPVAINKGLRFVASDTEQGIHQWDVNDSIVVTPTGMKIFDRWGELIWEAADISAGGITFTDSLGDTTAVLRSQDDGVISNYTWKQVSGPFKFDTRAGAGESGSLMSLHAASPANTRSVDITVDTGDVIISMNKGELIDAIAKEARLTLTDSGSSLQLKAFDYVYVVSATDDGLVTIHTDSTGDTLAVWHSNSSSQSFMLGAAASQSSVFAVSDTSSALIRIGGLDRPTISCSSDGNSARLLLDGRSSFDPNGGAIAYAASASGCTLVVMSGPTDTTWLVDQDGNMKVDGYVSVGTPEQLATLTVAGDICATGSIGACSDERFKTDITHIDGALETVSGMHGVLYRWNRQAFPERNFSDRQQIGLIAQELLALVPEAVVRDRSGYYSIDYGKLTPLLVEAIKEQQNNIDSQTVQISALQNELRELKALVQKLVQQQAGISGVYHGSR